MLGLSPYDADENTLDDSVGVASGWPYTRWGARSSKSRSARFPAAVACT
jgi:hypothetical protein